MRTQLHTTPQTQKIAAAVVYKRLMEFVVWQVCKSYGGGDDIDHDNDNDGVDVDEVARLRGCDEQVLWNLLCPNHTNEHERT